MPPERDPDSLARSVALRQLAAAPRSRAQLGAALARRGVPEDVVERVLDRFAEVGLVDDVAYAELLVRSRHTGRGLSRRALARELHAKGISREVAEGALAGIDGEDERRAARALVARRVAATAGMEPRRRRRRLVEMLARRGYSPSAAAAAVEEVLARTGEEGGWAPTDLEADGP